MARPLSENDQIEDYNNAKAIRSVHENDWRLASAYCLPAHYGAWTSDGPTWMATTNSQAALRRTVFDSTGVRSLPKYMAILERLATPAGMKWHTLGATDTRLMKSYRVRMYFDELNELLFRMRYMPRAGFRPASNESYASIGAYGTGPLFVGKRQPNALSRTPGMLYKSCALRDIFFLINANGEVDKVFRRYYLNVRMFKSEFPNEPMPRSLAVEAAKAAPNPAHMVEFFHVVQPRSDYDPQSIGPQRHEFVSSHMCVPDKQYVGQEGGYASMPYLTPRAFTVAGDPYGHGPAVQALAAMGGASTMKKSHLKQGNLAAEPVILAYDDGVLNGNVDLRPGHVNYGGVDRQGRKLIQTLDAGRFDIGEALLQGEQKDVEDAFLVTLFQILVDTPEMTATEVLERVAEKAALLSPTMGRIQSEKLGPLVEREIDVCAELGLLPEMPPELIEARGEYDVTYTSPLAKGMYAEEVSAFMRSVEFSLALVERTQNPEHLDHYNFSAAIPEIADKTAVPARWMADPKVIEATRTKRSQEQQQAQLLEAAPAMASVAKTAADIGAPK